MATKYFQMGASIGTSVYSGEDSSGAAYPGFAKTIAIATIASGDTVEIPLVEIPAGAKIEGIALQIDALIAASGWTCAWVMRKKANSIFSGTTSSVTGVASGAPDITLVGGALTGGAAPVGTGAGVGALAGAASNIIAPNITGNAVNIWASVFPQGVEGTTLVGNNYAARQTLQESYYLGLLFTSSGTVAFPANVNIFTVVDAEFTGTL